MDVGENKSDSASADRASAAAALGHALPVSQHQIHTSKTGTIPLYRHMNLLLPLNLDALDAVAVRSNGSEVHKSNPVISDTASSRMEIWMPCFPVNDSSRRPRFQDLALPHEKSTEKGAVASLFPTTSPHPVPDRKKPPQPAGREAQTQTGHPRLKTYCYRLWLFCGTFHNIRIGGNRLCVAY